MDEHDVDVVVPPRHMQLPSTEVCARLPGRVINTRPSSLPGGRGAEPYQQAFDRGVTLSGATAHCVTAGRDEGPIIEQDVLQAPHADDRVQVSGARTVVFSWGASVSQPGAGPPRPTNERSAPTAHGRPSSCATSVVGRAQHTAGGPQKRRHPGDSAGMSGWR